MAKFDRLAGKDSNDARRKLVVSLIHYGGSELPLGGSFCETRMLAD